MYSGKRNFILLRFVIKILKVNIKYLKHKFILKYSINTRNGQVKKKIIRLCNTHLRVLTLKNRIEKYRLKSLIYPLIKAI